jgi:3'-phosphoadenosine 5'-phosphosulfate sulfotransferase (PAPS reductase)/FAD synthetase
MIDLNGKSILIGLSGGINSMAVLCWLKEQNITPAVINLFYAHLKEHSPDTFQFVSDGIRFARKHFPSVKVKVTRNSALEYFESKNMIPHPMISNCSRVIKIEPMELYSFQNGITVDLVGYVKHELKKRSQRQISKIEVKLFEAEKHYPIGDFTDEWCFEIVEKYIGWYPLIYKILDEKGRRIFLHNNCLPCKNMTLNQMEAVKRFYPSYHRDAMRLTDKLNSYWGRSEAEFYATFGRDLGQESTCEACKW